MITISKKINISSNAIAPYEWRFEYTDSSCISEVSTLDSVNNVINVTFSLEDNACLVSNPTVKFYFKAQNCDELQYDITLTDPCDTFVFVEQTKIIEVDENTFRAPVKGGGLPYTYEWTVDPNVLEIESQNGDSVVFNPIASEDTTIGVTVTDANGCELTASIDYTSCAITFQDNPLRVTGECNPNGTYVSTGRAFAIVYPCVGLYEGVNQQIPIDWSTLDIDVPFMLNFENFGGGFFTINFPSDITPQTVQGTVTVSDFAGNTASTGIVVIINNNCEGDQGFVTPIIKVPYEFTFACVACQNLGNPTIVNGITVPDRGAQTNPDCLGPIEVPITDLINTSLTIDYNTFTFIQLTGQTLVSSVEVLTPNGTAYFTNNQTILYVPNLIPANNDPDDIKFSVEVGGTLITHTITFDREVCGDAPIAVNDNICVTCTGSTGNVNLLANDLGNIDPTTFNFLGPFPTPTQGILSVLPNGVINFNPAGTYNGTYQFSYNVANSDGVFSNNALVTITVNCLNETDFDLSICQADAGAVSLWNLINDVVSNTGLTWYFVGYSSTVAGSLSSGTFGVNMNPIQSWAIDTAIASANIAKLDLSTSVPGFYNFQYRAGQGSCEVSVDVTIEVVEEVDLPDNLVKNVCTTEETININNCVGVTLPDGEWNSTLPETSFNPSTGVVDLTQTGAGSFTFNYVVENPGTFNVACSTYFTLTLIVESPGFNVGNVCYYFCSNGPTPDSPNCQTIPIVK